MKTRKILNNKWYLYLTEFFSGMSVMAVELGASRLLAPYFSSSQIVWTIIIGTIMIAMALGNIFGGRWADKNPNPDKLYGRIIIAAIWIALIPVVGKYIVIGVSALLIFTVNSNFLVWAAFVACMILFVFPLFLLGTVTPSLVKYTVDSLDDSGKVVGTLGAFNTIGSIIGTFLPTFVTIPAVGTSITSLIFAGILLVLALVYFLSEKTGFVKVGIASVVFILSCIFGASDSFAFWESNLAYEGESVYNYLQVKEDNHNIILSTNVLFGVQSILKKDQNLTGMYYDYAMAALVMAGLDKKDNGNMLVLGMGTGTYATQCRRYFNNIDIEGVEIDEKITELAGRYFELPEDIKVATYDGRAFLNSIDKKYDVIMVDAYQDITIPFQMSSVEFFSLVKDHLTKDGVMVVNMNMRGSGEGNINEYLSDTIASVFNNVYTVDVAGSSNRELFAAQGVDIKGVLDNYMSDINKSTNITIDINLRNQLNSLYSRINANIKHYNAGDYIMTDDKAPVELLGMQVIDELINNEVDYYRNIYNEKGLKGLIDSLQ